MEATAGMKTTGLITLCGAAIIGLATPFSSAWGVDMAKLVLSLCLVAGVLLAVMERDGEKPWKDQFPVLVLYALLATWTVFQATRGTGSTAADWIDAQNPPKVETMTGTAVPISAGFSGIMNRTTPQFNPEKKLDDEGNWWVVVDEVIRDEDGETWGRVPSSKKRTPRF